MNIKPIIPMTHAGSIVDANERADSAMVEALIDASQALKDAGAKARTAGHHDIADEISRADIDLTRAISTAAQRTIVREPQSHSDALERRSS